MKAGQELLPLIFEQKSEVEFSSEYLHSTGWRFTPTGFPKLRDERKLGK